MWAISCPVDVYLAPVGDVEQASSMQGMRAPSLQYPRLRFETMALEIAMLVTPSSSILIMAKGLK
jgi:hypothetical protein